MFACVSYFVFRMISICWMGFNQTCYWFSCILYWFREHWFCVFSKGFFQGLGKYKFWSVSGFPCFFVLHMCLNDLFALDELQGSIVLISYWFYNVSENHRFGAFGESSNILNCMIIESLFLFFIVCFKMSKLWMYFMFVLCVCFVKTHFTHFWMPSRVWEHMRLF